MFVALMKLEMEGHFFHCYDFMTLARILGNDVEGFVLIFLASERRRGGASMRGREPENGVSLRGKVLVLFGYGELNYKDQSLIGWIEYPF